VEKAKESIVSKQHLRKLGKHFGLAMTMAQAKILWRFIFPAEVNAAGATLYELSAALERAVRVHAKETASMEEAKVLRKLLRNVANKKRAERSPPSPEKKKRYAKRVSLLINKQKKESSAFTRQMRQLHGGSARHGAAPAPPAPALSTFAEGDSDDFDGDDARGRQSAYSSHATNPI
jgi:hypothetical protein